MKYREIIINQLKSLPYFDKEAMVGLSEQYAIKDTTVDVYISRSMARKDIIQLKKGTYVTADFYEKNIGDIAYKFYLANVLRAPSYVSSWTALQYYDLTTEVIQSITSVTSKVTRTYTNKAGSFAYQAITKEFFSGFSLVQGKFNFFIAAPAKALFDLLYFKTHRFRGVAASAVPKIIQELRVDLGEMEKKERTAFFRMIKNYLARHA